MLVAGSILTKGVGAPQRAEMFKEEPFVCYGLRKLSVTWCVDNCKRRFVASCANRVIERRYESSRSGFTDFTLLLSIISTLIVT